MKNYNFNLPEYVNIALERLAAKGNVSYIVGGCVRDLLLNKTPTDYDMCTSATPLEIKEVFSNFHTIDTGIKHGTVSVIINNNVLEITTFRKEDKYFDHRRPSQLEFTSNLNEDLVRRDFTINAMAYNKTHGLIDNFSGINDLSKKQIRAVGKPQDRFSEDALRMLRAIRFSAVLGFDIEESTKNAIISNCSDIKFISKERISAELTKLLLSTHSKKALLENKELLFEIIPILKNCFNTSQENPYHIYDVYTHSVCATESVPPVLSLKLCALLHDIGKVQCKILDENGVAHFLNHTDISVQLSEEILKNLKFDNKTRKECLLLIKLHDKPFPKSKNKLTKKLSLYGYDTMKKLIKVKAADIMAQSPIYKQRRLDELYKTEKLIDFIHKSGTCYTLKQLAINGHDLKCLPIDKKDYSKILNDTLHNVIFEQVRNEKQALMNFIKKKIK